MGVDIAFWILAVVSVAAALMVVTLRNVFRAALALILCLVVVAGIYVTLSADFLAAVQILVYVGGISILVILAIMLTRAKFFLPEAIIKALTIGMTLELLVSFRISIRLGVFSCGPVALNQNSMVQSR